jgi:hypothetical protein
MLGSMVAGSERLRQRACMPPLLATMRKGTRRAAVRIAAPIIFGGGWGLLRSNADRRLLLSAAPRCDGGRRRCRWARPRGGGARRRVPPAVRDAMP